MTPIPVQRDDSVSIVGTSRCLTRAARVLAATALLVGGFSTPAHAAAEPTCGGQPATIIGTPADDQLTGTPANDVIVGLEGDDTIDGLRGNDLICGDDGDDQIFGGAGDDSLHGGTEEKWDVLSGGQGDDRLDCGDTIDEFHYDKVTYERAKSGITADLDAGVITGATTGTDTIMPSVVPPRYGTTCKYFFGTRFDDTIKNVTETYVVISARGGDDVIDGVGYGVNGDRGDDTIRSQATLISGGLGEDFITVTGIEAIIVRGDQGADHLVGSPHWDSYMYGGGSADWLEGMGGDDGLHGGPSDDLIQGGDGDDYGFGGDGTDRCDTEFTRNCEAVAG